MILVAISSVVLRVGDWLISTRAGRWILLAACALGALLIGRAWIVRETRHELEQQNARRAAHLQRRMAEAAANAPRTDDELVDRLRRGSF